MVSKGFQSDVEGVSKEIRSKSQAEIEDRNEHGEPELIPIHRRLYIIIISVTR